MTTQHTPGPWLVCDDGVNVYAPDSDTAITNSDHPCAPDFDEANFNARLIAAAPDLFAACNLAVVAIESLMDELGNKRATDWGKVNEAMIALGKAIVKARGELP